MLQDHQLQLLRECSRDSAAFDHLKALCEELLTSPVPDPSPLPPSNANNDARLAALVQSSQDAIFMHTLDGRVTHWNPAAEKIYGYSAAEMIGQSLTRIIPPDLQAAAFEMWDMVAQGAAVDHYETVRLRKDGQAVEIALTVSPVYAANGCLVGISVIGHDISEEKRTRFELAQSEARLRNLFETLDDSIYTVELPSTQVTYINPAGEHLMGRTLSEFQRDFAARLMMVHAEDVDLVRAMHVKLLAEGFGEAEYRIIRPDGTTRCVNNRAWLVRDAENQPIRYEAIARDITELREARAALEESERRMRSLFDSVQDAIFSVELPSGYMSYLNPAGERIMGRSLHDFQANLELRLTMGYPDDTPVVKAAQARLLAEGTTEMEVRIVRPDGSVRWVHTRAWLIKDANGQPIRYDAISRDITEHKLLRERQNELEVEQRRAQLLNDFITNTSHELRTPLTTIGTGVYLMSRFDDPVRRQEKAAQVRGQIDYLNRVISQLHEMARLDRLTHIESLSVHLESLLSYMFDLYRSQHPTTRITAHFNADLPTVAVDLDLVQTALRQVIDNAIHFSPEGSELTISGTHLGNEVVIAVEDHGVGIPPEHIEHIFEHFYKVDEARTLAHGGTGMGLTLVQRIMQLHGGYATVHSTVGVGTILSLHFPAQG